MSSTFGPEGSEGQDVKLTDQERKLIGRLLSDPTYFPVEFRTWLKNYIESAGINVTAGQIRGSTSARTGMPAGMIVSCGAVGAIPPDALACDGAAYSRITYVLLFNKIGTTHGAGDGVNTFNVPDMRDRAPYGAGSYIPAGGNDGQAYGGRRGPVHHHGTHIHGASSAVTDPGHPHRQNGYGGGATNVGRGAADVSVADATTEGNTDPAGTNISVATTIAAAQVGVSGGLQDTSNWVGVVYAITTGQTA